MYEIEHISCLLYCNICTNKCCKFIWNCSDLLIHHLQEVYKSC